MRLALLRLRARRLLLKTALALLLISFVQLYGCSSSTEETEKVEAKKNADWHTSLEEALAESRKSNKPLLVLSIAGDLKKQC
jgi:hypothetical protein